MNNDDWKTGFGKMKKILVLAVAVSCFSLHLFAHSGNPKYHVVIDTDGAIDDMRALSMFLSGNDIRILAVTCSQGTLLPKHVFGKVKSLTTAFHCEGIPVGVSQGTGFELPPWSMFAQNISWSEKTYENTDPVIRSDSLLNKVTAGYNEKITLIALGSLKTYADWIAQNPAIAEKIGRIIWYNSHTITQSFNYKASPESYQYIKNSGIPLEIVANTTGNLSVNAHYISELETYNSVYAKQIIEVHKQGIVKEKLAQNHLKLWDDLVPLYMTVPMLFEVENRNGVKLASLTSSMPEDLLHETIGSLLVSSTQTNDRVFAGFPVDTTLYLPLYAKIVNATIEKYGLTEWKAITMTNEIHGHTGIYSIIGAKMGVRAMEYFHVGVNNMRVTTFAGSKPPLSCFNDGLQISTGATIGQGLLTISDSISNIPSAVFKFNNRKIHISVKKEIAGQMQDEIKYGVKTYGLLTDQYWLYIEKLAITYWTDFNRHKMFIIREME